jgi:hypothetical protein
MHCKMMLMNLALILFHWFALSFIQFLYALANGGNISGTETASLVYSSLPAVNLRIGKMFECSGTEMATLTWSSLSADTVRIGE